MQTLLLDQGFQPLRVLSWHKAYTLVFSGKAEELVSYDAEAKTATFTFKIPAVIRLLKAIPRNKKAVRFSRVNILTRDKFMCCYCGCRLTLSKMTYDHVVPRSRYAQICKKTNGCPTTWENIVSSCMPCNSKKRNRTPEEAGMRLLTKPYKPLSLPMMVLHLDLGASIPEAWRDFVYWHGELDQT